MEKNNGDNKQFGMMRMIIVFLSIIIILLLVLILIMFNKNNSNSSNKINNGNNTNQVEKDNNQEDNDVDSDNNDEDIFRDELLAFDSKLNIDSKLVDFIKEITIDLGDRENPLFDKEIRVDNESFVELALNMLPSSSRNNFNPQEESSTSASEVGVNWDDGDPLSGYVDAKALRKKYKEVFGKELENKDYHSCPFLLYSSKYDRYYTVINCGGTGYVFQKYVYDYKVESDMHYVYVAYESAIGPGGDLGPKNYNRADKFELVFEKKDSGYIFSHSRIIS